MRCKSRLGFASNADTSPLSVEPKEMHVFHHLGRKAVRAAASVIVFGFLGSLAGCGGGGGSGEVTTPPPDNTPTLQSIEITPSLKQAAAGTTAQFTATGVYTDNSTQDLTAQATWESSDSAVATVNDGLAITAGVGSTTVSAISGDVSGDTMLTVTNATLVSIEVSPAAPSLANGLTQQFTATGLYTDNSTQDLTTQVTWASSNGAVATVSDVGGSNGLATTAGVGSTTVSATSGGVTGDATLTVTNATLVSIEVSPSPSQAAGGTTAQFTATGLYTDNSTQDLTTQVTWASSDGAVATVSNAPGSNGLATTAGLGSTTVSASSGGVTGETTLTVTDATLVSIEVSPAAPSIANGLTQEFTATGLYTDNSTQDLTTQVTWASSDGAVATVSNAVGSNGLATTASVGSTTVSASRGGVTGETTLTVTDATLVSIEVSPAAPSIANGLTQQFTATGLYTDNSTEDLTAQATWASSDSAVATVSNAPGSNGPGDHGRPRQHHRVCEQRRSDRRDDVDGDRRDPGVDRGVTGGPQHREWTDSAVHGDRPLHGQLDGGPHGAGDLGIVRHRGGDYKQRRRLERAGDGGRARHPHRVCDQRRSDR